MSTDSIGQQMSVADADVAQLALRSAQQVSFRSLMLGEGPRFARDAFGPVVVFYLVWKLAGLAAGIVAATVFSILAFRHERRSQRKGNMALISLGFVVISAVVGLVSRSATVYLAQPVLLSACFGIAFLVSAAIGKPLAGTFAEEMFSFPKEVKESRTFKRVFARESVAWGAYLVLRSAVRLLTLTATNVEFFLLVNFVTGVPVTAALMTWSIWYGVRGFRRSAEWGWAMRGEPPPADVAAGYAADPIAT